MSNSEKTAHHLREVLPVRVTPGDVEKNPEFVKLLEALSQHITPDGTSASLGQDLAEERANLRQAKICWLEQQILYTELQEMLLDHQLKSAAAASDGGQFYDAVLEMLTLTEISDYIDCHPDPSSNATLLGLKKEDVERRNPHKRHLQSIQQKLIPDIESCLRKKCEALVSFHESCCSKSKEKSSSQGNLTFAKASQLPSLLEAEQSWLVEEKRQLAMDKLNRDSQLKQYAQTLLDSLAALQTLITKHRLRSQSERDRICSEWLTARCDAMCLKIKTIQLQAMCDTYYSDTVHALKTIRRHLDKAIADTDDELYKASEALKAYETVGMGFDALVEEFTHLRSEVDNRRWTLRELKIHGDDETLNGTFSKV